MKVKQVSENLWQLTRYFVINCYLVREADGLTLVDAGMQGSGEDIIEAARNIGLPITRLALTHAHVDHVGSLDEVAERLPDAVLAVSPRSAEFLSGRHELHPDEQQGKLNGGYVTCTTQPTRLLEPGDKVGSLRVVESPGHSPDHIAFFDERDGTLIAGDAYQTQGGVAVSGVIRLLFPPPAMATWHLPTALASAKALRQLEPTRLAVGHGPVLADPLPKMDKAIAAAEAKVNG